MASELVPSSHGEFLIYQTEDNRTRVQVRVEQETVWLTQKQMAELFQKDVRTVSEHIRNIFDEGELLEQSVVRKFRTTAADGKQYDTLHFNLDVNSGELQLIEVQGVGGSSGSILLTANEHGVAEDRRECYWLYVVTGCATKPELQGPVKDPAWLDWHEVSKVQQYWLDVDAGKKPMAVQEDCSSYGETRP